MENLRSQIATSKNAEPSLRSQSVTLKPHGGRRTLPYAFTEQGVAMLSSVLRSPRAVEVNIAIMRTFVQLRRLMDSNALLAEKIEALEAKYADHDQQFQLVFDAIKQLITAGQCREMAGKCFLVRCQNGDKARGRQLGTSSQRIQNRPRWRYPV
jgi:hypothetical protein